MSAEFAGTSEKKDHMVFNKATQTYTIKLYVDSQNSFGVNIRTKFIIKLKRDADNWTMSKFSKY